ncbi:MAG: acyl-homoserine-lactone synthase [Patescibacteria group bacterium]|jgi:N-acyl-L-homoserine lactone synthetase
MKVLNEISLRINKNEKTIYFGMPDHNEELVEMYKFRYRIYLERSYIIRNQEEKEVDDYDDGRSVYFIAKIDDRIIGTVRLIRDEYLPTEKDCFQFQEPLEISKIPRNKRAELGRLIVERYDEKSFLPRHLVLLGLTYTVMNYALENNIYGGYSFIKDSLRLKLEKLKFPFHFIKDFKQVYCKSVLSNYFKDNKDPVWPIYYLSEEVVPYCNKIFNNQLFFKRGNSGRLIFRNQFIFKVFQKLNAL